MEIRVRLDGTVRVQDGAVNLNEILVAMSGWSRELGRRLAQGVIEAYQDRVAAMLCSGEGQASWVAHEARGAKGQLCAGGAYRSGGRRECRMLRTELGPLTVETRQLVCGVCGKRFRMLGPLLNVAPRSRPTVGLRLMTAETMTDLSYRKGGGRMAALAQVEVPKSSAHRWMLAGSWDELREPALRPASWEAFQGLMADATGYKRQGAWTTRGDLQLLMGVTGSLRKLVPLGVWANRSWDEIDEELLAKQPEDVRPPIITLDGERGQEVLGNLAQDVQRCHWHLAHQLGFALWKDGLSKPDRTPHLDRLAGIIRIELPAGEYRSLSPEMRERIQGQLRAGKKAMSALVASFQEQGFLAAASYVRNASAHTFTVVEKWLELGYLPPKAISLLERVMRELGRRIKKIGASWKETGVLAVARVLLTRIYDPEQWRAYWANLLDLHGRCGVTQYSLSFSVS